jgi:hypothetical protein
VEFGYADESQIRRLHARFGGKLDPEIVVRECAGKTMAEVQHYLMEGVKRN